MGRKLVIILPRLLSWMGGYYCIIYMYISGNQIVIIYQAFQGILSYIVNRKHQTL